MSKQTVGQEYKLALIALTQIYRTREVFRRIPAYFSDELRHNFQYYADIVRDYSPTFEFSEENVARELAAIRSAKEGQ